MTALLDLADTVEDLSKVLRATGKNWDWAVEDLNEVEKFLRKTAEEMAHTHTQTRIISCERLEDLEAQAKTISEARAEADRLVKMLQEAREFINDNSPDWYAAKQRMLAEINAALTAYHAALPGPTQPSSSA